MSFIKRKWFYFNRTYKFLAVFDVKERKCSKKNQLTSTSSKLLEAMMTGSVNFEAGFGAVETEITAELISKAIPLSLYALEI